MMRSLIIGLSLLCVPYAQYAQGYTIDIHIEGLSDTTIYIGNFFGESTFLTDTARLDASGHATFSKSKALPAGVYFIVLNKSRLFDFPVNADQKFSLRTKHPEYIANMKVEGDSDNQLFFADLNFNMARNQEAQPYVNVLQDSTSDAASKELARQNLGELNDVVVAHQDSLIREHPNSIIAKILKASRRPEIPEAPEGAPDDYRYKYYKKHFWDNFDLSDPTLLRLPEPYYSKKVDEYLDNLVYQVPDSLIKEIDAMVEDAKENQDTYKYLVWLATIKYQYPEIMGLDAVFVHLYDTYFASGEMDFWANAQLKKNLQERAIALRGSLIGQPAPNLRMQDANLQTKSLYDIDSKYTVIYFFDPDCGHCRKETPKLVDFYANTDFDVEVFAVSADTSMVKMKEYINEMDMKWITVNGPRTFTKPYQSLYDASTTPTIYVLDEKKKIIAKKLPAERLQDFLTQYEAVEARKRAQN